MYGNDLISICIPTSDRLDTLRVTLPDLISKIKHYEIKIYLHENVPKEETREFIEEVKKDYPYIVYFESDKYREADENIKRVLSLSDTKYRWLFGDHYIILDGAIDIIYDYISGATEYDALILHYKGRRMFRNEDFLYNDPNLFLVEMGWYIGMLSTTIYSSRMLSFLDFEKYYDTCFVQSLSILDYISRHKFKIQYISNEAIWNMKGGIKGDGSWHHMALEIFAHNWFNGINSLDGVFHRKAKIACIKNHAKMTDGFYSLRSLLLYRFAQGITLSKVIKYIRSLYVVAGFRIVIVSLLLSMLPRSMIKIIFPEHYQYIKRVLGNLKRYSKVI